MIRKLRNAIIGASMAVLLLLMPNSSVAQDSDLGNWLIYIGSKKINPQWNFHHEVQYRNYNAVGDLEQLLLRTGIGYNLTEGNNNLLLGYGFISSANYVDLMEEKVSINEHRIFQQFVTKHKIGKLKVQHRYRFEQRFVSDDFKLRYRYFLAMNLPLALDPEKDKGFYLSAYNEIFLNASATIFDRNRTYFGVGKSINKNIRLELGYMNQFFSSSNRDQFNLLCFANF